MSTAIDGNDLLLCLYLSLFVAGVSQTRRTPLYTYIRFYRKEYLSTYLYFHLPIPGFVSVCLSACLYLYLSTLESHLSPCVFICVSICFSAWHSVSATHRKALRGGRLCVYTLADGFLFLCVLTNLSETGLLLSLSSFQDTTPPCLSFSSPYIRRSHTSLYGPTSLSLLYVEVVHREKKTFSPWKKTEITYLFPGNRTEKMAAYIQIYIYIQIH